jgi:uncharacterized protein YerC
MPSSFELADRRTMADIRQAADWSASNKRHAFLLVRSAHDCERIYNLAKNHAGDTKVEISRVRRCIKFGQAEIFLLNAMENPDQQLAGRRGKLFIAHDAFTDGASLAAAIWRKAAVFLDVSASR